MDRREILREVFKDTQRFCREEPILAAAVEQSRTQTKLYEANDYPIIRFRQTSLKLEFPDTGLMCLGIAISTI